MAQGSAALANMPEGKSASSHSANELYDIQQYNKIVEFRDAILSGKHPKVKLPPGITASQSPSRPPNAAVLFKGKGPSAKNLQYFAANGAPLSLPPSASSVAVSTKARFGSGNVEINPILLEKSEPLIRAEIKLQRQKLERALRDEVEQRRGYPRIKDAEPLTDFDLSDVLSKALTLVQATAAHLPAVEDLTATNDAASDSFDDNTFYSSQHNTPDSRITSQVRNESEEPRVYAPADPQPGSAAHAALQNATTNQIGVDEASFTQQGVSFSQSFAEHAGPKRLSIAVYGRPFQVPGLNNYPHGEPTSASQNNSSGEQSFCEKSRNAESQQQRRLDDIDISRPIDRVYVDSHPPSPLVRTHHDLSPVAPHPDHISPLVVGTQYASSENQGLNSARGAPAQVSALRHEQSAVSTPASSPRSGKRSDKQKQNRQKRKAVRQAPEDVMPYIKPEPRSPSPMNAPAYIRPSKRQKQSQRHPNDMNSDELSIANGPLQQFESRPQRGLPAPVGYTSASTAPQRSVTTTAIGDRYVYSGIQPIDSRVPVYDIDATGARRLVMPYSEDQRMSDVTYIRRHPSPRLIQRSSSVVHSARPIMMDDGYREAPRTYGEPYETLHSSVRPESDPYGPPRPPPTRIVVDSFGREYIEPPRPTIRQSVAPIQFREQEVAYERVPLRAVSRHPGPSHQYAAPAPEYAPQNATRGGEYSTTVHAQQGQERQAEQYEYWLRPSVTVPGQYERVMAPPGRPLDAAPREFAARAVSVRPVEHVRYEMPPQDYARMQSVRPEAPGRDYAGSVHPEGRRDVAQPYAMDYGMRQVEQQPVVQRGYSVRPVERYYEQPPRGDAVAYVERPPAGAPQDVVYNGRFVDERGH